MSWKDRATSSPTSAPTRKIALLLPEVSAVVPLKAVAMVAPVTFPAFASCARFSVMPSCSNVTAWVAFAPMSCTVNVSDRVNPAVVTEAVSTAPAFDSE